MKKYTVTMNLEAEQITEEQINKLSKYITNGFTEVPFFIPLNEVSHQVKKNPDNSNESEILVHVIHFEDGWK